MLSEIKPITLMKLGIPTPIHTKDRDALEKQILPYFSKNKEFNRILFVGVAKYTWHYRNLFSTKEYWTIEPNLMHAVYGSKRHIVGYLDQIDGYFRRDSLDAIICNGVLGYGLNDPKTIELSFKKCLMCLREGGILVLGWNNRKDWSFLPPDKYDSIKQFEKYVFPPLGKQTFLPTTDNFHTFTFYKKPPQTVRTP